MTSYRYSGILRQSLVTWSSKHRTQASVEGFSHSAPAHEDPVVLLQTHALPWSKSEPPWFRATVMGMAQTNDTDLTETAHSLEDLSHTSARLRVSLSVSANAMLPLPSRKTHVG